MTVPARSIFTVTELTACIRATLEQVFPDVWVEGEVSNVRIPSSGHWYFTLKDEMSQIRVVMFRNSARHVRFTLQDGMHVIVCGRLTVYEPRGEYQLIVVQVEPKGIGALQLAFEQLKERLAREGLFDPARKRPLPFFPRKVGIITSLSGAAIRDMLAVLARRCPVIQVLIYPVTVQGEGAADQVTQAIQELNRRRDLDVIIVGRGGGSFEDLWCFNEERVVRAIAQSRIPIVSAVGHEVDVTLADFAADYRAPTPSAAAEAISPDREELNRHLRALHDRLLHRMVRLMDGYRAKVHHARQLLPDPLLLVHRRAQRLDELDHRLRMAIKGVPGQWRPRVHLLLSRLLLRGPRQRIYGAMVLIPQLTTRLRRAMPVHLSRKRHHLNTLNASLHTLSPLAILSRGYSVLESIPERHLITSVQDVAVAAQVRAYVRDGHLRCVVDEIHAGLHPCDAS